MRVGISFAGTIPVLSIGDLEGTILVLWGRTQHIVSKDPMNDTLSTWFNFFIEQEGNSWNFGYKSNCEHTLEEDRRVIDNLLGKANRAIVEKKATDLSDEFNALNSIEPYSFGGLFSLMDERHEPAFGNKDPNQMLVEIREKLRNGLTVVEIESDEHLKSFVFQNPLETIWVADSSGAERKNGA